MKSHWEYVIVAIGVLASDRVLQFIKGRINYSHQNSDKVVFREDLQKRVRTLEQFLIEERSNNETLMSKVLELTAQVAKLSAKVEFLEKENKRLHDNAA